MNHEGAGVISIDDGGFSTVVCTKNNLETFDSIKGLYGNRTLTTVNGKYDFIVDYKNERYVLGSLAKYDCAMPMQMHTKSKQHLFYDLSVLTAIHQYGYSSNFLITSVPIKMHNEEEKNGRISRLKGSHTITVNGIKRTFSITDCKIAPETASVFWLKEPLGKTRYIDLGSRTIGAATVVNEDGVVRFIDTESDTFFGKGLEALNEQYDAKGLADYICGRLIKTWNTNDSIFLLGGGALDETLVQYIKKYFPLAVVIDDPVTAGARSMYLLGRNAYGMA